MTAVAIAFPQPPRLPEVSPELAKWLYSEYDLALPDLSGWSKDKPLSPPVDRSCRDTPEVRAEAQALLPAYQMACRGPDVRLMERWMQPLAFCKDAPEGEKWKARVIGYAAVMSNFPWTCFTEETSQWAVQKFIFFPTPAEICALLQTTKDYRTRILKVLQFLAADTAPSTVTSLRR